MSEACHRKVRPGSGTAAGIAPAACQRQMLDGCAPIRRAMWREVKKLGSIPKVDAPYSGVALGLHSHLILCWSLLMH
jgi:hypothetical protein